jgi:ketosteroid isomerase-like protein
MSEEMQMNDEEQIKGQIRKYADIIHTQDTAAWEDLWSEEPDNTLIAVSAVFRGFPAISRDFLEGAIKAAYSSIALSIDGEIEVHFLTQDIAVAVFSYHTECRKRGTGEPFGVKGPETQIWMRSGGVWKLVHDHYSMS